MILKNPSTPTLHILNKMQKNRKNPHQRKKSPTGSYSFAYSIKNLIALSDTSHKTLLILSPIRKWSSYLMCELSNNAEQNDSLPSCMDSRVRCTTLEPENDNPSSHTFTPEHFLPLTLARAFIDTVKLVKYKISTVIYDSRQHL